MTSTQVANLPKKVARKRRSKAGTKKLPPRADRQPFNRSVLSSLGVIGLESVEPVILAALISREPLLLIGPHGTGKSYLLNRLSTALDLECRHYNASLLNFDDLVGYPLPDRDGSLKFIRTPASIWDAEVAFLDEISRCRPDLQNKLFPIIHERKVQGILLEKLIYRWSAMNPPATMDSDEENQDNGYVGSEPLDIALADRFAFIVEMPGWSALSHRQQEELILASNVPVSADEGARLRGLVAAGQSALSFLHTDLSGNLTTYVRIVCGLLVEARLPLSPRRAAILLRNILAVHAARVIQAADADLAESALLALIHSFPQRAVGTHVNEVAVLAAHREAWKGANLPPNDPRKLVLAETNPIRRALLAARLDSISAEDFSLIIANVLATLPAGGSHAIACALFESGAAGRFVAAVAEQCAELCSAVINPQDLQERVPSGGLRRKVWQHIEATLAAIPPDVDEGRLLGNLLTYLFTADQLATIKDVDRAVTAWTTARVSIREAGL
jgi:MoxR-like ATPase